MVKINQEELARLEAIVGPKVKVKDISGAVNVGIGTISQMAERLGESTKIKRNSRISTRLYYCLLKEYNPQKLKEILSRDSLPSAPTSSAAVEAPAPTAEPTPEKVKAAPEPAPPEPPPTKEAPLEEAPPTPKRKAKSTKSTKRFDHIRKILSDKKSKPKSAPVPEQLDIVAEPAPAEPTPSAETAPPTVKEAPAAPSPAPVEPPTPPPTEKKTEPASADDAKKAAPPSEEPEESTSYTQKRIQEEVDKIQGPKSTGEIIDLEELKRKTQPPKPKPKPRTERLSEKIRKKRVGKQRSGDQPVISSDRIATEAETTWTSDRRPPRQRPHRTQPDWTSVRPGSRPHRAGGRKKRKKERRRHEEEQLATAIDGQGRIIEVSRFITVAELAKIMDISVTDIISKLFDLGIFATANQRLEEESIQIIGEEFGYTIQFVDVVKEETLEEPDNPERLQPRPPIVVVMGHVDHGKTSLLDYIRQTEVAAREAGGITQQIGAYRVHLDNGQSITFIDTPGHEAFTTMRARGAKITDIAVIVVAADDGVMPQTREAISHAQAAEVDIIFAINKIDKPNANPDRVFQQLAEEGFLVEAWGGDYPAVKVSAKTGEGIDELLETISAVAELRELKADPEKRGVAAVLESKLEKGRGYVASIIVLRGKIQKGDPVLVGPNFGRVRAMFDETNQPVQSAGPSTPVLLLGLDGAPPAGETLYVTPDEQTAREIAAKRKQIIREQEHRAQRRISLEDLGKRIAAGDYHELNFIIRGDTEGSVDALINALQKLERDNLEIRILHRGVGEINESDVVLAATSEAVIIGFNVRPNAKARQQAEAENVQIRTYSVIYEAVEDVENAIKGMLKPETREVVLGTAEVKETFKIRKVGTVAGCQVTSGKVTADAEARVIRNGVVIHQTRIASLKHYKDDVREVRAGMECGILLENFNDVKVGDVIEAFTHEEVPVE